MSSLQAIALQIVVIIGIYVVSAIRGAIRERRLRELQRSIDQEHPAPPASVPTEAPVAALAAAPESTALETSAVKVTVAASLPPGQNPHWMVPEEFIVIDLETTGLSAKRNRIIEIGALKAQRSQLAIAGVVIFPTYQALVRVKSPIPQEIVTLTGITDAMLKADGVPLEEALAGLLEFCGTSPLIAFNAPFDIGFLRAALGDSARLPNRAICALSMTRRAYPGLRSYRLSSIMAEVNAGQSHRALADCHRALIAYLRAARRLGTDE